MPLAIIPARGNSKDIPNKNLEYVGKYRLLQQAILDCANTRRLTHLVVSSESQNILANAFAFLKSTISNPNQYSLVVRPAKLSEDNIHAVYAIIHVLITKRVPSDEIVLMVLPTSPFRGSQCLDTAIELIEGGAPAVIGIHRIGIDINLRFIDPNSNELRYIVPCDITSQRQDRPDIYKVNGAVFVARCGDILKHMTFHIPGSIGLPMNFKQSLEIDTREDLQLARYLISN